MNPALILRNVPNFDIYSELSLQVGLLWSCLSSYLFAINPFVYLSVFRSSEGGSRNQLRHLESLRFLSAQTILGLLFFLFFFFFLFLLLLFIINTSIGGAVVTWLCPLSLCRWVREFLNEENQGLDVLVEYLSFAQYAVTQVDFCCFFFFFLRSSVFAWVNIYSIVKVIVCVFRFDGEQSESGGELASIDSPWSRSIEDLHGDCSLPSPSSSVPRASRHSIR